MTKFLRHILLFIFALGLFVRATTVPAQYTKEESSTPHKTLSVAPHAVLPEGLCAPVLKVISQASVKINPDPSRDSWNACSSYDFSARSVSAKAQTSVAPCSSRPNRPLYLLQRCLLI